jgi:3-phosphoshikimate 1-carboxyvinyltransferase
MLAALFAEGETVIHEPGPARDHTERMLRLFGVDVDVIGQDIHLRGGQTLRAPQATRRAAQVDVPADFSSAAFPLVAATMVPGSAVRVPDVCVNPTRTGLYDLLLDMGAQVSMEPGAHPTGGDLAGIGEPTAALLAGAGGLRAIDVGGDVVVRAIDEFPIFAVAATQAEGVTTVRDASELRVKETDRIGAVARELAKMGAHIEERPDGLVIHGPAVLHGAVVESHRDHRLSMALAVAGLVAHGETVVQGAEAIEDSFPGFVETMRSLGADIEWA